MRQESRNLPVVIVAGMHTDARRQVVEQLLRAVPGSVALHHDLSTANQGSVRRIVRDVSGELDSGTAPLVNDCACCALREDLLPELERLTGTGLTLLAIVELWDSVEPKAMAEVVCAHGSDGLELTGVITAVDPALVLPCLANGDDLVEVGLQAAPTDQRTVGDTWARQLEYAPVLALVESEEADEQDTALLAQLHPTARQVTVGSGELAAAALAGFDVEAAAAAQHPACALLPQEAPARCLRHPPLDQPRYCTEPDITDKEMHGSPSRSPQGRQGSSRPARRGWDHVHRLQEHRSPAEVHFRPRQDPQSARHPRQRSTATPAVPGDQERTRDGAPAVQEQMTAPHHPAHQQPAQPVRRR